MGVIEPFEKSGEGAGGRESKLKCDVQVSELKTPSFSDYTFQP